MVSGFVGPRCRFVLVGRGRVSRTGVLAPSFGPGVPACFAMVWDFVEESRPGRTDVKTLVGESRSFVRVSRDKKLFSM